ncbi:hypothetical protein GCM10010466_07560 [Planomonospora alba]|uniref:Leucine-rich repeat domain-containing protein n=1 Tax=Planomonospora alba TaxID=161354 RepID=A0ABP6MM62_9ACTN
MFHDDEYDEDLDGPGAETPADPRDPGEAFVPADGVYRWDMAGAHRETYAGLPVAEPHVIVHHRSPDPAGFAWPLYDGDPLEDDDGGTTFADGLRELLATVDGSRIRALVVAGCSARNAPAVLAAHAHRLPRLRSLFLGLVEPEHWEISWIQQGDITPVLEAFPRLRRLDVRGSDGLVLRPVRHAHLEILRFETGGLPGHVVRALGRCELPALTHLELWRGTAPAGAARRRGRSFRTPESAGGMALRRRLGVRSATPSAADLRSSFRSSPNFSGLTAS